MYVCVCVHMYACTCMSVCTGTRLILVISNSPVLKAFCTSAYQSESNIDKNYLKHANLLRLRNLSLRSFEFDIHYSSKIN